MTRYTTPMLTFPSRYASRAPWDLVPKLERVNTTSRTLQRMLPLHGARLRYADTSDELPDSTLTCRLKKLDAETGYGQSSLY